MSTAAESDFVFNLVLNGTVFRYLRYCIASQLSQSDARFRFVVNACPAEEVALMERMASKFSNQVVEIFVASERQMIGHGAALDAVRAERDDGDYFCMIDPDIVARGPFLSEFATLLDTSCAAVSSGRGVWCETDVIPEGHPGVSGEYFYAPDGYLFGSPHFAIYKRAPLEATLARWPVGFGSGGPDVSEDVKARLAEVGRDYWLYDTAKIVNILFQEEGNQFCHIEHPALLHVGGMSHYLSPPGWSKYVVLEEGGEPEPDWGTWKGQASRFETARFCAAVLRARSEGRPAPEIPAGVDEALKQRLALVRDALVDVVAKYEAVVGDA